MSARNGQGPEQGTKGDVLMNIFEKISFCRFTIRKCGSIFDFLFWLQCAIKTASQKIDLDRIYRMKLAALDDDGTKHIMYASPMGILEDPRTPENMIIMLKNLHMSRQSTEHSIGIQAYPVGVASVCAEHPDNGKGIVMVPKRPDIQKLEESDWKTRHLIELLNIMFETVPDRAWTRTDLMKRIPAFRDGKTKCEEECFEIALKRAIELGAIKAFGEDQFTNRWACNILREAINELLTCH
jgi:hypothetical protein